MKLIEKEIQDLLAEYNWAPASKAHDNFYLNASFEGKVFDFQIFIKEQAEEEKFKYEIFHIMHFRGALYSQLHFYADDILAVLHEMSRQKEILHKENYQELVAKYFDWPCDVHFEDADGEFFPLRVVELAELGKQ